MAGKGKLIVFEGLDGAGTTTQMKLLGKHLEKNGKKVFITHEPTDNPIGKLVRDALQKKFSTTPEALAFLYASDRDDHLYNPEYGIIGHLDDGEIVITDRYFYSSIAYQGVQCNYEFIASINSSFPHADCIIFIDTPPSDCMSRIEKRGEEKELFEKEEFLKKVRENYLREFSSLPEDVSLITIDGRLSINEITAAIISEIGRIRLL